MPGRFRNIFFVDLIRFLFSTSGDATRRECMHSAGAVVRPGCAKGEGPRWYPRAFGESAPIVDSACPEGDNDAVGRNGPAFGRLEPVRSSSTTECSIARVVSASSESVGAAITGSGIAPIHVLGRHGASACAKRVGAIRRAFVAGCIMRGGRVGGVSASARK